MALSFLRPTPSPATPLMKVNVSPARPLASLSTQKLPFSLTLFKFPPCPSTDRRCLRLRRSPEQLGALSHESLTDAGNGSGKSSSNNDSNGGGSNNFWGWWRWHNDGGDGDGSGSGSLWAINSVLILFICSRAALALSSPDEENDAVWEVRGGKWIKLVPNNDTFIVAGAGDRGSGDDASLYVGGGVISTVWVRCRELFVQLMLPEGFPDSVTSDYLDYSLWRGVQGIAAQVSGVLATQALLYAVGLGKGAIPTAAVVNWVLKDGIGYVSKICLSKFGRHFDVHPRGWRLFADLLENAAFGMEMLTPAFPHLFVFIGAVAGAGRSAAGLIQAATRSCFYAGFAAQRNFAEVIAKGEAQGMVSRSIGIVLGIGLANCIGTSTSLSLVSFIVVTSVHMFCNLKSYQSIQLRTLNPYRGSLVFSEYLLSGQAPSVKEVNDEEPLFPAVPILNGICGQNTRNSALSSEAKDAAAEIEQRLQLGSKLSNVIHNKEDAFALFDLFQDEGYILAEHQGKYCVVLKEDSSPQDMLKLLFHVNYLYWLERNAGIIATGLARDCKVGGRLRMSLEYVQREFKHAKDDAESAGWVTDGLIARPLPNRIRWVHVPSSVTVT
ncbi:protein root UVB sensitive 1, chloroplastic [Punica granatum]|uniref:Uncharacterized protein n=2 Tax=Punica granatum TaxID=22663 RepID=A0A218WJN9_PUNGR|nr:protein root UVB sensitive 1, chloroplastic [Punica granatum]OWM72262.1 hypothetical protein CDL15_Pgr018147 [Punica granatum]PKI57244.1 hypothetical protein CRG98_022341 [Punica granatum]